MKEEPTRQTKNAIMFSIGGLLSLIVGYVSVQSALELYDHEEAGTKFFWNLMGVVFFISLPYFLFIKSLLIILDQVRQEKTRARTFSVILTTLLGAVLTYMLLIFLWENFIFE